MSGILTAFFDLLTYPLITLGVPLITHFMAVSRAEHEERSKYYIRELLLYSISWGIGYIGMWAGKWLTATCLTEENIISNAMEQIRFRSGSVYKEETYTWLGTIESNMGVCNKEVTAVVFSLLLLGTISYRIIKKSWVHKTAVWRIVAILAVSVYPFVWYRLTMNHSSIHAWFMTWRELAISVYGVVAIMCMDLYQGSGE